MPFRQIALAGFAALSLAAASAIAFAQDLTITTDPALAALTPEEMVEKRQEIMRSNGGTLRSAGALTGAEAVAAAESLIAGFSNLTVLYPEGSVVGDSKALPTIWTNNEAFQALLLEGVTAATAMKAAAESGDTAAYGAAAQTIGGLCGACHQQFRS